MGPGSSSSRAHPSTARPRTADAMQPWQDRSGSALPLVPVGTGANDGSLHQCHPQKTHPGRLSAPLLHSLGTQKVSCTWPTEESLDNGERRRHTRDRRLAPPPAVVRPPPPHGSARKSWNVSGGDPSGAVVFGGIWSHGDQNGGSGGAGTSHSPDAARSRPGPGEGAASNSGAPVRKKGFRFTMHAWHGRGHRSPGADPGANRASAETKHSTGAANGVGRWEPQIQSGARVGNILSFPIQRGRTDKVPPRCFTSSPGRRKEEVLSIGLCSLEVQRLYFDGLKLREMPELGSPNDHSFDSLCRYQTG